MMSLEDTMAIQISEDLRIRFKNNSINIANQLQINQQIKIKIITILREKDEIKHFVNANEKSRQYIFIDYVISQRPLKVLLILKYYPKYVNSRDEDNTTALMEASFHGNMNMVNLLLEHGANPDLENNNGDTAITDAALGNPFGRGHIHVIRLLLEKGANIDYQNYKGETALIITSSDGNRDVVRLLIEHGANLNLQKKNTKETALIEASYEDYPHIVSMLIRAGANLNMEEKTHKTALMAASRRGHIEIVRMLLEAGADFNKRRALVISPLFFAEKHGHTEVVQLLRQYGATE